MALPIQSLPSAHWISTAIQSAIEQAVSAYVGRNWRIHTFQDLNDLASHPCGIFSDGVFAVFAKLSRAANGLDQFEVEMAGLRLLAAKAGVMVPIPIQVISLEQSCIMLMEAARPVERSEPQWRDIGRALARIHQVRGPYFGFDQQGYFGPAYQDNRPMPDWISFFTERRLWPSLSYAIHTGQMPSQVIQQVEKLIARLPGMDIPISPPVLLHGDAQANNYISTAAGAVVIDPAVYYGLAEVDLAHLETFQKVPSVVFEGYREILPIDAGFEERRDLWRIPAYLLCIAIEGQGYLPGLKQALEKYI